MIRGVVIVVLAVLAAACNPNAEQFERAKKSVVWKLKDPESAKFAQMHLAKDASNQPGELVICGRVNAKNSFGGYEGYKRFVYQQHFDASWVEGIDGQFASTWVRYCD